MLNTMEDAQKLLDFNEKLDIGLLDKVVMCLYQGSGDQQKNAQVLLTRLKEHPESWTRVDSILEFSSNQNTKFFALQVLEQVVATRWRSLPRTQCEGIRKYIVSLIIKISSVPESMDAERIYLRKLNFVLVQILKREWPRNCGTFISDIVGSSRSNESLCMNNMNILALLSEEVFEFSAGRLTQNKIKQLKDTMCREFGEIFHLCMFVMENSNNAPLVGATLETLLRFLNWIPLGYVFETKLVHLLIFKFLNVPLFRNLTLQCLTEVSNIVESKYDESFLQLIDQTILQLEQMLPLDTNIRLAYASGQDAEQRFIQNLAVFLSTFLRQHGFLVEKKSTDTLQQCLGYLVLISEVEETEIFKICLEYWNALSGELYGECAAICGDPFPFMTPGNPYQGRRRIYSSVLTKIRVIMVGRMAKPEEVLVVENDQGEIVREFMKDTDAINMYKSMREILVFLTHLDYADTERVLTEKLQCQVDGSEWSWKNLNTLCWAIGSISGALHEEDEKRFLVLVIRDLLGLCENKKGKDNKAIIASNIMYVVGQYPRFLRAHWKFLKTVVNKLFEFMHETHDGVQDMACDTFIKIAQKCRKQFVVVQMGELWPFIEEILSSINSHICDLHPAQVQTFYEAVGYIIAAHPISSVQEHVMEKYMSLPNQGWDEVISQATQNVDVLKDQEAVKQLANILKTNVRACSATGHPFIIQMARIYLDMLNVYKVMSENISAAISLNGESVTCQPLIKTMRVVRKETLNLISVFVSKSNDNKVVLENFITPLFDAVLLDYQRTSVAAAREPEVLSTIAVIVNKLGDAITPHVPKIFDTLFECTLDMINKDFEEYPDHRTNFFGMLLAVNQHCFAAFMAVPPAQFKLVLDAVIWAVKHTMRNVAEIGLQILEQMLTNLSRHPKMAQPFYQTFYTSLLHHMFTVVTDTSHTANLAEHAAIMSYMFSAVEQAQVTVPLAPDAPATLSSADAQTVAAANIVYIKQFVANLLRSAFPHFTDNQIKLTVQGFFDLNQNQAAFKEHIRDFLVQIKEYTGDDADLFLDERELELRRAQEEKRKQQEMVPGIINPHEKVEQMQD